MPHPDDYQYYIDCGCEDRSDALGIQKMPEPYALMLNADGSHFFWFNKETGDESDIHWSMWAVYRGAKEHAATKGGGND